MNTPPEYVMDNKEVAGLFHELAVLMEIIGENPFKIRSYEQAYRNIRGMEGNVLNLGEAALSKIPGFGKAIVNKIQEIKEKGTFTALEKYRREVPPGLAEISQVSGLGAKKVKAIYSQLGISTLEALLEAAMDGRLTAIKGISHKSIAKFIPSIEYLIASRGKMLYSAAEALLQKAIEELTIHLPDGLLLQAVGQVAAFENVVDRIDLLVGMPLDEFLSHSKQLNWTFEVQEEQIVTLYQNQPLHLHFTAPERFGNAYFECTATPSFQTAIQSIVPTPKDVVKWEGLFEQIPIVPIPPERWHAPQDLSLAQQDRLPTLIEKRDVLGLIHLHTTYSDGSVSLEGMVQAAIAKEFEYIVVTDHSRSAGYAGGLKLDEVYKQWEEIEKLRLKYPQIDIYKGIESDILKEGDLDYPEEVLSGFDLVIGSVHSGLEMDEATATQRLQRAIEHPRMRILGHMTGRLLLRRSGYPVDHLAIIEACAKHGVAIEINANPRRLDIDWQWIREAVEQGVYLSIQPDAHSLKGVEDIHYGVRAGRKGGLTAEWNLTSLCRTAFRNWLELTD